MTVETMQATELPGETNAAADDVPSVPPSAAVALVIAVLCGAFAYAHSPGASGESGPLPTAQIGTASDESRPAAWADETGGIDERTVADLAMEGWNAGAAEEARL